MMPVSPVIFSMDEDCEKSVDKPFIPKDGKFKPGSDQESSNGPRPHQNTWFRRNRRHLLIHGIFFIFYSIWTTALLRQAGRNCWDQRNLFTPVQDYIRHRVDVFSDRPHDVSSSKFVGTSSPELDKEWYRLLRHELRAMNQTSIPLQRGGGYMGMMAVFHELHCLVRSRRTDYWQSSSKLTGKQKLVREAVHKDYYYQNESEASKAILVGHTEHCIDILRMGSMCRADTAIFPYHWTDGTRLPSPTWFQKHECVDWDDLTGWLEKRRIDIYEPNLLVHPKYGPAYPGGKRIEEPNGPQVLPLDEV
ncbi:hypothetical protein XA68_15423 [Ophiocordyceps unilateralis]|uniref:Uncharacterized protein n=1 Tax=Ophiocordyceps unilateralis TaxID=268505 RepID=A0A2A9P8E3_OPHUN|nr:hypothetical protein XA68_15423 [Ophiocordyceps unilateralis]